VEVERVTTPQPTDTWTPISHLELVCHVERTLQTNGLVVGGQAHSLSHEGQRYFGLMEVQHDESGADYCWVLGLAWAFAYVLTAEVHPTAFAFNTPTAGQTMDGTNSFYYSFVTLSTVGYGDITPVSPIARMLSIMESMTGSLYVAVLIARLVSLYAATPVPAPGPYDSVG
jgi:hypothetical protein